MTSRNARSSSEQSWDRLEVDFGDDEVAVETLQVSFLKSKGRIYRVGAIIGQIVFA